MNKIGKDSYCPDILCSFRQSRPSGPYYVYGG